jgi:hypothetical protein
MCLQQADEGKWAAEALEAANLCVVCAGEACYAMPTVIRRCAVRVAPTAGDVGAVGAFVDAIFHSLRGVRKAYSGATQNITKRLLCHQSDLLPNEEWSVCHVLFCTPDVAVARRFETIQNHIVHNVAERSGGQIVTPNAGRSLISRGLRHPVGQESTSLYTLYLLTRQ